MAFKKNLTFYLGFQLAKFISPALLTPYLAHVLGTDGFADFVLWNSCVWTSALFMEFGFYIYGVSQTALAETKEDLEGILGAVVTAKACLTPLACLAYLIGARALGLTDRQPVAVAVGVLAVVAYGGSFAWYYQGLQRGGTAVLLEMVPQLLQYLLIFVLVRHAGQTWLVATLQTAGALTTIAASIALLRRDALRWTWRWRNSHRFIAASAPFFFERASYTVYATSTPLILGLLISPRQAAYYGLAEKANIILTAIIGPLTQAATPLIIKRVKRADPDWTLSLRLLLASVGLVTVGAMTVFYLSGMVIRTWFDPSYLPTISVMHWFCLVSILMTSQLSTANFVLIPAGLSSQVVKASLAGLVSSLALQAVLVPRFGASGSVMARVAAEGVILAYFIALILRTRLLRPMAATGRGRGPPASLHSRR